MRFHSYAESRHHLGSLRWKFRLHSDLTSDCLYIMIWEHMFWNIIPDLYNLYNEPLFFLSLHLLLQWQKMRVNSGYHL
jgi:hypothetical protein